MNLPRRQKELYDRLFGRGDVLIVDLYEFMRDPRPDCSESIQDMQRYITPYIAMLNKNLADHGMKVEPGALKNTYRLVASS